MRVTAAIVFAVLTLLSLSCEIPSDLGGTYEPKMAAYGILSTFSDTQYVRLIQTIPESEPFGDTSVKDAAVQITGGGQTFTFRDTVLTRQNGATVDSFHVYVCYPFKPVPNVAYSLQASSPTFGVVQAQATAPGHTVLNIDIAQNFILRNPYASHAAQPEVDFRLSAGTAAYQVHLEIEYKDITPTDTTIRRYEVPERIVTVSCFGQIFERYYPRIIRNDSEGDVTYLVNAFNYRKSIETVQGSAYNWELLRVIFTVVQFNGEWYKYYRSVRSYEDRFSVRLDRPDYSNVNGGLGLFGAYVVDTVSTSIPAAMFNPNPQDVYPDCN